jgi:hypothetical protein
MVDRDAINPSLETGAPGELSQMTVDTKEDFLGEILRDSRISGHPIGDVVNHAVEAVKQLSECIFIAVPMPLDQVIIRHYRWRQHG